MLAALILAASSGGDLGGQLHPLGHAAPPALVVTINPEARVTVKRGDMLPPGMCGEPVRLQVLVRNAGFVTARLKVRLIDSPAGVLVTDNAGPLRGTAEELRELQIVRSGGDPIDVTIAFSLGDEAGDLAGRDRVHMLLRCT
jgi:hypothetical protein